MVFTGLTFQSEGHNHKPKLLSKHYECPVWHGQQQIYGSLPVSSISPLKLKKKKKGQNVSLSAKWDSNRRILTF